VIVNVVDNMVSIDAKVAARWKGYFIKYTVYDDSNMRRNMIGNIFLGFPKSDKEMRDAIKKHIKKNKSWDDVKKQTLIIDSMSIIETSRS